MKKQDKQLGNEKSNKPIYPKKGKCPNGYVKEKVLINGKLTDICVKY